jgi:transposase
MSNARPIPRSFRDSAATRQLWADRLKRFRTADQTVAAFCAAEGVSVPTFYQWKRRLTRAAPPAAAPTVVPVRITTQEPTTTAVEALLPSGTLLRFAPVCDPRMIAAVLRQLGVAGC